MSPFVEGVITGAFFTFNLMLALSLGFMVKRANRLLLSPLLVPQQEPYIEAEEAEVEAHPGDAPALPMDPDNPPFPRVYHHRNGRPVRACHCHGRPLEDGETVLWWPNPDIEGAFWLVCSPEHERF